MKRMHLNVKVTDLAKSTTFYSELFGCEPAVVMDDYVKWMPDDPFINFSIEPATAETGVAHVGLQASDEGELQQVYDRVAAAAGPRFEEGETTCCYAHSHKNWTRDPDGLVWEAFYTDGQRMDYGKPPELPAAKPTQSTSCC